MNPASDEFDRKVKLIGREEEKDEIKGYIETNAPSYVVIIEICGSPGVGKKALANHVAHDLLENSSKGYLDLFGKDLHDKVLHNLLGNWLRERLKLDEKDIPPSVEGRINKYHSLIKDKAILMVLHNPESKEIVDRLLPKKIPCVVLITKYKSLALQDSRQITLKILTDPDALSLLKTCIGERQRVQNEPEAAKNIIKHCSNLPLAICLAGSLLRVNHHWSLDNYAEKLADEGQRLNHLDDEFRSLHSCFELSYGELKDDEARLFRLLSLLPKVFSKSAAKEIIDQTNAEDSFDRLVAFNLLEKQSNPSEKKDPDERYQFCSLLRDYATEKLGYDNSQEKMEAKQRLIEYFLKQSARMKSQLDPDERREIAKSQASKYGTLSQKKNDQELELGKEAFVWFEKELPTLATIQAWISESKNWDKLIRLSLNLAVFLDQSSNWKFAEELHDQALYAADQLDNCLLERAKVLSNLGCVYQAQQKSQNGVST